MIYIGIDPGTNTGLAVWDGTTKKFIEIRTTMIHRAMAYVEDQAQQNVMGVKVIVEDPRKIKLPRELQRMGSYADQGVGSVKRDASIWEDFLKDINVDYEMVWNPRGIRKLSSQKFKEMTGWDNRTTEHGRDAAMLVWGK